LHGLERENGEGKMKRRLVVVLIGLLCLSMFSILAPSLVKVSASSPPGMVNDFVGYPSGTYDLLLWGNPLINEFPDTSVTAFKIYKDGSLLATVDWTTCRYRDYNPVNRQCQYGVSAVNAAGEGPQKTYWEWWSSQPNDYYDLTLYCSPPGAGYIAGMSAQTLRSGQTTAGQVYMPAMVTAHPAPDYNFTGPWTKTGAISITYYGSQPICYIDNWWGAATITGYFQQLPAHDVTIAAHCNTEGADVSVPITMDGASTGYNTPHVFSSLTGSHTFAVPNTDPSGHPFTQWNTGETTTTITVAGGGTYTAYYQAPPPPTYDVTINAHCNTEGADVNVAITKDGSSTGFSTPHTFTGLTGTNSFSVPSSDASGHPFLYWNTGQTTTTITVSSGGTYLAYYQVPPPETYTVSFIESGLPPGTQWGVTLNSQTKTSTSDTIAFNVPSGSYSFSVASPTGYTAVPSSGGLLINGPWTVSITFVVSLAVSISPTAVTMDVGQSQLFTAGATGGTPPYAYKWYLDTVLISGATSSTWTFTPTSAALHSVFVRATDALGVFADSVTSSIIVHNQMSVSISPTSVTRFVDQSQTFTMSLYGGSYPYTLQWYLNGNPVPGATNNYWIFSPAASGSYVIQMQVRDSAGATAASNTANAQVLALESYKGIRNTITGVTSILAEAPWSFSLQQNFWIQCLHWNIYGTTVLWCQNCIKIAKPTGTMMCDVEIWNMAANPPLLLYHQYNLAIGIPDKLYFESVISGKAITFANSAGLYIYNMADHFLVSSDVYVLHSSTCFVVVGLSSGANAKFVSGSGYVTCQTMIDNSLKDGYISGIVPHGAETGETSTGLAWDLTGHFTYLATSTDEGVYFEPNYYSPTSQATSFEILGKPMRGLVLSANCPVYLDLYDDHGRCVGYNKTSGEVDFQIDNAFWVSNQTLFVFDPSGIYRLEVTGTDNGTYELKTSWQDVTGATCIITNSTGTITKNVTQVYAVGASANVALINILSSKTVVCQGFNSQVNVTVADLSGLNETFDVVLYANGTTIGTQRVFNLSGWNSTVACFAWNTTGFAKGNYTIWAYAWPVLGESDTTDNTFTDGWVILTIPGDIDGSFNVDGSDLGLLGLAWYSKPGDPNWNPNADLNNDGLVDGGDLGILGFYWFQTGP
jgi:hypothetical protein